MDSLERILQQNEAWSDLVKSQDSEYFTRSATGQSPAYLWIGCADSRVSAEVITSMDPGELFVHRNVANLVPAGDSNSLSVIEYAVAALKVEHIIVCGHYKCGGIKAVLDNQTAGVLDTWLESVKETKNANLGELAEMESEDQWEWLCELNVQAQVETVVNLPVVQKAWSAGQSLHVHGLIYDIAEGRLNNLDISRSA